jgi:hypothetical protein
LVAQEEYFDLFVPVGQAMAGEQIQQPEDIQYKVNIGVHGSKLSGMAAYIQGAADAGRIFAHYKHLNQVLPSGLPLPHVSVFLRKSEPETAGKRRFPALPSSLPGHTDIATMEVASEEAT